MRSMALILLGLLCAMAATGEDAWFPSKYGAEDTLGAINELSEEGVLAAAKLVHDPRLLALLLEALHRALEGLVLLDLYTRQIGPLHSIRKTD